MADGVQLPQQELNELLTAVFGNHWKTVDNDECVQALLEFDFILLLKICRSLLERGTQPRKLSVRTGEVNLLLLLFVEVLLGQGVETGRHDG